MSIDETDHMDKPSGAGNQGSEATSVPDVKMASTHQMEPEHRRTDHDRQSGNIGTEGGGGDAMNVDKDAAAPTYGDPGLDSLQKDFTSAFHLCKSCKSSLTSVPAAVVEPSRCSLLRFFLGLNLLTLVY
jgi:hypothetical protein